MVAMMLVSNPQTDHAHELPSGKMNFATSTTAPITAT
jgi:hypothetical protein